LTTPRRPKMSASPEDRTSKKDAEREAVQGLDEHGLTPGSMG